MKLKQSLKELLQKKLIVESELQYLFGSGSEFLTLHPDPQLCTLGKTVGDVINII